MTLVIEEGIKIKSYGDKITKKLNVFYNPAMKINRDVSLLLINSYFDKKIKFCDPMAASGIRELRFLDTIPKKFEKLVIGDVSKTAIKNIEKNFKLNKIKTNKIELINENAINTIAKEYYDFIEIDPFGTPVPFIDIAIQRIKHNGILSITATDTAALCGTYPKKTFRRYGMKVEKTLFHEEVGLRNLIAYVQRQGAKYEKALIPILSFSENHFYKIFFKVEEGRQKSYNLVKDLKYFKVDKNQNIKFSDEEKKEFQGKTYIGKLNDKSLIKNMIKNIHLIEDRKKIEKLLNSLNEELDIFGYINPHKLGKEHKFSINTKFEELFEKIKHKKHKISRVHNNPLGIKTTMKSNQLIKLLK